MRAAKVGSEVERFRLRRISGWECGNLRLGSRKFFVRILPQGSFLNVFFF